MDNKYEIKGYEISVGQVSCSDGKAVWSFTTKIDYGYTDFSDWCETDEGLPKQEYQEQINDKLNQFVNYAESIDIAKSEMSADEIEAIKKSYAKFRYVVGDDYDNEFEDFVGMINSEIDKMSEEAR